MNKSKRRRLSILLILFTLLCLVTSYFSLKGWRLYQIALSLQETQAEFETLAADGLTNADPAATAQLVRDVRVDVVDLQAEVEPLLWLTPYLGWLPEVGELMPDAREYLQLADAGTRVGEQFAPSIEAGLQSLQLGREPISSALTTLDGASSSLQAIESDIATIQTVWAGLETKESLPWAVRQFIPQIDAYLPLADEGVEAGQILPALLGVDGEKQYLLLIQNDDERRATGGFISGVGTLRVANGQILSLDFRTSDVDTSWLIENSELLDWPPEPLTRYMNLQYLLYRDANYWPDFPTSAVKILELYHLEYPDTPDFDGLIALDQQFVSILLSGTGAVYVPELEQTVDSSNVVDVMRRAWDPPETVTGEWFDDRKSFVGDVAKAIQERVLTDPTQLDLVAMGNAMLEAVETRHLQIYSADPAIAAQLAELGWESRVAPPANSDFLLVVDTNMGYNKSNGVVEREIEYSVNLDSQEADLAILYHHTGAGRNEPCQPITRYTGQLRYQDMLDACFYNFVRVYTADGSTLVTGSAHPTPGSIILTGESFDGQPFVTDETHTHFANYFVVTSGTSLLNTYQYTLPEHVAQNGVYRLLLQKQAGARMEIAHVHVTVPTGATIATTTPTATINGTTALFELPFDRDIEIEVAYTP